jgi:putative phosphoesterase
MRIAIIADIHGNLPALEAALAAVEKLKPDRLIVAGDVVDGAPDSAACWERVKQLDCVVLRGNHERYVFDYGTERAAPEWATPQFAPLHYTRRTLSQAQQREMAALPLAWTDQAANLLVVHASPRSDADTVLPHTSVEKLDEMFAGATADVIVRSHNHICSTRDWHGRRIVTTGSVGLSLDGQPEAQFCLLTRRGGSWQVEHHSVKYDVEATLRRFRETGYLDEAGPIGILFMREIATGAHHIVPFLRYFGRRRQAAATELDLKTALADFMRHT